MEKLFSKLKLFNNFHSFSIKKNQVCFMIIEIYVTCYIQIITQYHSHGVTLSDNQKAKLARAFKDKSSITLRLSNHELSRNDELMLTKTQLKKVSESNCIWCKCWCQVIKGIVSSCCKERRFIVQYSCESWRKSATSGNKSCLESTSWACNWCLE